MGLTNNSVGAKVLSEENVFKKKTKHDKTIALAGNPNVGKSTVFNALTGMNQHTGNWPGKTVTNAFGYCKSSDNSYLLVDIPGTYSLMAHSQEEEIARNFICFSNPDAVVVVCDATVLERNLNLVLQTLEMTGNVIVCVNLLDEAKKKKISINLKHLSDILGVPVVGCVARKKKTLKDLLNELDKMFKKNNTYNKSLIQYNDVIENSIKLIENVIKNYDIKKLSSRWLALRLLECDDSLYDEIIKYLEIDLYKIKEVNDAVITAYKMLSDVGINKENLKNHIVSSIVSTAEDIADSVLQFNNDKNNFFDRKIDKLVTSKKFGYPLMILLLLFVFWFTIFGANYLSEYLSDILLWIENVIIIFLDKINTPATFNDFIIEGLFRIPSWVISVMLPPMAVFFPLFTLLEDVGYLPRIAYNLDKSCKRCHTCGKQALTMCMGFGCNAAGVTGARIIDSPRERLLAILTNSLVPCNGKFPSIILLITVFFSVNCTGFKQSVFSAFILTAVILISVCVSFLSTSFLSKTILKGVPSSFTLELPSYRKPQIGKVIVRSVFERTLFVLGRALTAAVPAGILIYFLANINISGVSILNHMCDFLEPLGRFIGLDGIILTAFILGLPANEIVLPIAVMAYMSSAVVIPVEDFVLVRDILTANGWNLFTAISFIVFSLFHWPCATTLLTVKKETGSIKWTFLSVLLPTLIGIALCIIINAIRYIFV